MSNQEANANSQMLGMLDELYKHIGRLTVENGLLRTQLSTHNNVIKALRESLAEKEKPTVEEANKSNGIENEVANPV